MKYCSFIFSASLFFTSNYTLLAQCANDNTLWIDITPPSCPGTNNTTCIFGGEYVTVSVVVGQTYVFQTCGDTDFDTQITLYNNAGGGSLGYNDDACGTQSSITWAATFTGVLRVLVDKYSCLDQSSCMTLSVSCSPACANYTHPTTTLQNTNLGACMVSSCCANYYDNGGSGANYSNNINGIYRTFCPSQPGNCIRATFTSFDVNDYDAFWCGGCCDELWILNGPTQNSTPIYQGCQVSPGTVTSSDNSGCLGFRFWSDGSVTRPGWAAALTCVPCAGGPLATASNDCPNYNSICGNSPVTGSSTGPGLTSECSGCVVSENYSNWYSLYIGTGGTLVFTIDPVDNNDDYDFALWGPNLGCGSVGGTAPVRCSYAANTSNSGLSTSGSVTDFSEDVNGDGWVQEISVSAGQTYLLLINKWTPGGSGYNILWTGSTAILGTPPGSVTVQSNNTCPGLNQGSACAVINAGLPPFSYNWNTGSTSSCINGLAPGTYFLTVTDGSGCTSQTSGSVGNFGSPTPTATPTNTGCAGTCNGSATVSSSGGSGPYTYAWSNGGSGTSVSSLCVGAYTVTSTDVNGCTGTTSFNINSTSTNSTAPTSVSVAPSSTICAGSTVTLTQSGGALGTGASYQWYSTGCGSGSIGSGASINVTPGSTTTYYVRAVGTCNTTTCASVTITVNSIPSSTFSYNGNQCTGNGFNFTNTGSGGTYSWTFPSGTPASSTSNNVTGVTWASAGTYTITHIVTASGCSSTTTQNITVYPLPTVSASGTNPLCNGGCTGTLTSSGAGGTPGYSYTWSTLGGGQNKSSVCAGTYTVTVSDVNGCTGTNSVTLTNPAVFSASSSATPASCNGTCNGTVTALGSGGVPGYSYVWPMGPGANRTSVCAGTYTVTVTDANGCTTTSTTTVTQPTALSVSSSATAATCNGTCNGTVSASGSGGTPGYSYNWGAIGTGTPKTGVCAGSYTVTITDANGCTATSSSTVSQPSVLSASSSGTNVSCNGVCNGTVSASASGGTPGYSYNWNVLGSGANKTGVCAGSYTVTITDGNSCSATSTINITQPSALSATASATAATCNGASNGSASASPSGGVAPYTYQWSGSAGFQTTQNATGLVAGSHSVTVTDNNGCTTLASATVNQPSAITGTTSSTNSTCGSSNGTATITAGGGTAPYTYLWSNGQTSTTATGLMAGSYSVTITDANSCTKVSTATVSSAGAPTATISASTNVNCYGGNNGSATVSPSGGTAPYTYLWSPSGGTNPTANGLSANTYCVNVTDFNNCVSSTCVNITQPTQLAGIPTAVSNATCNGSCNGSATISVSGGVAPYGYLWPGGGTTPTKTGLCTGTYNVTVTDNNGCGMIVAATITQPAAVSGSTSGTAASCFGSCNGDANLSPAGGTAPYTFLWDNSETVEDATSLCAGSHTVTITDANSCTGTSSVSITQPSALALTPSSVNSNCGQPNGQACISAAGGTAPYSYSWSTAPVQTTSCATGLSAGNKTVTVTDANGCVATNTITVNNNPAGTASATTISNATGAGLCNGQATASMAGGTAPFTYLWTSGETTVTATALCAGVNCVSVTDVNGCSSTACTDILQPASLTASTTATNINCSGACTGSADLTVNGGVAPYSYTWSNGATAQDLVNLCAGTYNVTITDANSNTTTSSVVITAPSAISTTPSVTNVVCNGACTGSISVSVSGGTSPYTYLWSNGQTASAATGLCAGSYTVTVTDNAGCTKTSTSAITQPTAMALTFSSTNSNCSASNGSASVSVSNGTPPYTYLWSAGGTASTQTGVAAGTYTVTVTDNNGCTSTGNTVVNNNAAGTASAVVNNNVSCNGNSNGQATASISGGTSPYTYQWSTTPAQNTATATGLQAGSYSVTITDAFCSVVTSVTITQPSALSSTTSATGAGCFGSCNGSASANPSGGTSPYNYQWNDVSFQTSQNATALCAGTYSVTVTDNNGCTTSSSANVTENPDIILTTSSSQSTCNQADGAASVSIVSGVSPYAYLWDANAANQTTATASGLQAACYSVTITDGNSCTKTSNICVTDAGGPTASLLTQNNVSCFNACDGFAQINISGGNPPYNYSWTSGDTTASAFNLCAGTYTGSMVDSTGCTASVSVTIVQPNALNTIISSQNDVSCSGLCDASATAVASGGISPYSYSWNDAATQATSTATGLCLGTYVVSVTDSNNCSSTVSVTITEPSPLSSTTTVTNAYCSSLTGSACVNASGGTSPFSYQWDDLSSQTTSCASSLASGTYNVTVYDSNNCSSVSSATVGVFPAGTATVSNTVSESCNGSCDGLATVSISGGTAPFTYLWSNNDTASTSDSLCSGNYDVTITDANGCASTASTTINSPVALGILSQTLTDATCFNQCDGSAAVDANGGTTPYTYSWDDPLLQTVKTATGLCAGTFTVTISDANNCTIVQTVSVGQPSQILITSSEIDASCGQANGSACISVSGGSMPYSYLWPNAGTNTCSTGLSAGTYIVTVNDVNNCSQNATVIIQNSSGPSASIASQTNIDCNGNCNGSATVTASSGSSPYSYLWNDTVATTSPTVTGLCAGNYAVTITDTSGCVASASVTISEPSPFAYNQQFTNPSCFNDCNGTASVAISGGTAPYSFLWSDSQTNDTATSLCSGNFVVTITDSANCIQTLNYTLANPPQMVSSINSTNVSCNSSCNGSATAIPMSGVSPYTYQWNDVNNQSTATANGLCAGSFLVTVTDASGCTSLNTVTISEPAPLGASISSSGNVACNSTCDGFAQVSASGGTPAYSYTWNNGGTSQLISGLCAGTYSVTVTDSSGCTQTSSVTITQPGIFTATITGTSSICGGTCVGQATVSPSGGAPAYSYMWSGNSGFQTSPTATGLCGGNYSVTITDANGCQITKNIFINQPTPLIASISDFKDACGGNNGYICAAAMGGTIPYTYQWNDPMTQTSACATGLYANCYMLNIIDANGCSADTLYCLDNSGGPSVSIDTFQNVTCPGYNNGVIVFDIDSGTLPYNIVWLDEFGNTLPAYSDSVMVTTLGGGTFTIKVTDSSGCVSSLSQNITEPNPIASAFTSTTNANCFGSCNGQTTVSVFGGSMPYSYSWANGQTSPTATGLCAGTYSLTISDAKSCTSIMSAQITEPNQIIANAGITSISCNGLCDGSIIINASGGTAPLFYDWSPNTNFSSASYNLCAGVYNTTITDNNGCTSTVSNTLNEPGALTVSAAATNVSCFGLFNANATASGSGGTSPYSYFWDSNTGFQTTQTATGLGAGTYYVTVFDNSGCSETASVSVSQPVALNVAVTATSITCFGACTGVGSAIPQGGNPPYTYSWNDPGSSTSPTATGLCYGTYTVTISDSSNCSVQGTATVTQPALLVASISGNDVSCFGGNNGEATVSMTGGTTPYSYVWSPNGGVQSQVSNLTAQTYSVTISDGNQCSTSLTITINEPSAILIGLSATSSSCDSIPTDSAIASVSGGTSPYTYLWNDPAGSTTPTATGLSSGTYTVTVTDANNCTADSSVTINSPGSPTALLSSSANITCFGGNDGSAGVAASGGSFPYSYLWSNAATSPSIQNLPAGTYTVTVTDINGCSDTVAVSLSEAPQMIPSVSSDDCKGLYNDGYASVDSVKNSVQPLTYLWIYEGDTLIFDSNFVNNADTGKYTVIITDANGCSITDSSIYIGSNAVKASFTASPMTGFPPLEVVFANSSYGNIFSYSWNLGDSVNTSSSLNPIFTYSQSGDYIVLLTVSNNSCTDTISVLIEIAKKSDWEIPNIFTPNGDDKNEVFTVKNVSMKTMNAVIYNRWGEKIYSWSDMVNGFWDGMTISGKQAPDGVYFYIISATGLDGVDYPAIQGTVTLVR